MTALYKMNSFIQNCRTSNVIPNTPDYMFG
jgi:hypothetical protein